MKIEIQLWFLITKKITELYTIVNTLWGQPGPNSYASVQFRSVGGQCKKMKKA